MANAGLRWGSLLFASLLFGQPLSTPALRAAAPSTSAALTGPLADYVRRDDSEYGWKVRRQGDLGTGRFAELTLTSQKWRDVVWRHQLFFYKPSAVRHADRAILMIGGGAWKDELAEPPQDDTAGLPKEAALLAAAADRLGTPVAVLMHVPFQPIFVDKLYEDAAIAYTFQQFVVSGDDTWPLLFPMVKSAVRAMDCCGEFATKEWSLAPTKFTLTGASKRGWTTWLTSAVDPRVECLAPMVIDMLNMPEHLLLQLKSWGKPSEQVHDYTDRGIHLLVGSPQGKRLIDLVDPYAYREHVRQPKFIILGTNDRYWPLESLNNYWSGLVDEKYVTYVPNNGHGLRDFPRVVGAVAAAHRRATGELTMPKLTWDFQDVDGGLELTVKSDQRPAVVSAWTSASKSRDFREVTWSSQELANTDGVYRFVLPKPAEGFASAFAEARFDDEVMPFYLSTTLRITEAAK